jgi:hypothetical protein
MLAHRMVRTVHWRSRANSEMRRGSWNWCWPDICRANTLATRPHGVRSHTQRLSALRTGIEVETIGEPACATAIASCRSLRVVSQVATLAALPRNRHSCCAFRAPLSCACCQCERLWAAFQGLVQNLQVAAGSQVLDVAPSGASGPGRAYFRDWRATDRATSQPLGRLPPALSCSPWDRGRSGAGIRRPD